MRGFLPVNRLKYPIKPITELNVSVVSIKNIGKKMNRKKKIKQTFKKLLKKENAKKQPKNKERYISKAERAAIEAEQTDSQIPENEQPQTNQD